MIGKTDTLVNQLIRIEEHGKAPGFNEKCATHTVHLRGRHVRGRESYMSKCGSEINLLTRRLPSFHEGESSKNRGMGEGTSCEVKIYDDTSSEIDIECSRSQSGVNHKLKVASSCAT